MKIKLFLNKDVNINADYYFKKAKKLKAKLPGVEKAIERTKEEIDNFEEKKNNHIENKRKEEKLKHHIKKEWYEKFRWTRTQNEFLFVLGKDAGSNEVIVKKYLSENDLIFHTEAPGSPFGILKNGRNNASKEEIEECAQFLGCFSQQWQRGFGTADVFWVYPEQVSKKAQSGEYIAKGAFMVYGEKNILKNVPLRICLGVVKRNIESEDENITYEELFSGTETSCKKYCNSRYIKIEPGKETYKSLTKEIKKRLKISTIEDLPKYIPNNSKILKK